jgi:predicted benzoate:H+ symporter BenE
MPFALPHLVAGFIAVMVGYTSVILIIQAATARVPMQPSSLPGYGRWVSAWVSAASASPLLPHPS